MPRRRSVGTIPFKLRWTKVKKLGRKYSIRRDPINWLGRSQKAPTAPSSGGKLSGWINDLLQTLLANMNGQRSWNRFLRSADKSAQTRSKCLNVIFPWDQEPALDDVSQIASMQKYAEDFKFYAPPSPNSRQFPMSPPSDLILDVACLLRASLYFFDLRSIAFSEDRAVAIVKGSICCRLDADSDALRTLLARTVGFRVKDRMTGLEDNMHGRPFRIEIPATIVPRNNTSAD